MVTLEDVQDDIYRGTQRQYVSNLPINLYQSPVCQGLVTQVDVGQHLRLLEVSKNQTVLRVCSCKDDYPGWIAAEHLNHLMQAPASYKAPTLTAAEIQAKIPEVIAFTKAAMATPNEYLWGGATAPDYDCSGLMQAAFMASGIQLPRDSYQQEDFTQRVDRSNLQPGDLIFFGTPERTTHVALYLGDGDYIHSSGKDKGRHGIGIDSITDLSHPVSQRYYALLRCFGRVVKSYQPKGL
ncbi:MAG: C40 family peptidase [Cyanobacteria bacterium J06555_13]